MQPLLALGPHVFTTGPLNYQSIQRKTEAKWPTIARFGTAPGRQFTGFGDDTITIEGLLYPAEFNDASAFDAVRASQAAAIPLTMLGWAVGTGMAAQVFGRVVILSITDTQSRIGGDGRGQRLEYSLSLGRFSGGGKPIGLFG